MPKMANRDEVEDLIQRSRDYFVVVAERDALRVRLGTAEELLRDVMNPAIAPERVGEVFAAARAFLSDGAP